MSAHAYIPSLHQQIMGPPEPPEPGDDAWLFMSGEVHLVRVAGRVATRTDNDVRSATSCILHGSLISVPTERLLALPAGDPYRMPEKTLP